MAAQMIVDVETKRRWWLLPAVYACHLLRLQRFIPAFFERGVLVRVKVGKKYIGDWQSAYSHKRSRDLAKAGGLK